MNHSAKRLTLIVLSAVLNILCYVLGVIPTPMNPVPGITEILIIATPVATCVAAGILAGSNPEGGFWLILVPAAMNAAVWTFGASVSGGLFAGIVVSILLGVIPGAISMVVTSRNAEKKGI